MVRSNNWRWNSARHQSFTANGYLHFLSGRKPAATADVPDFPNKGGTDGEQRKAAALVFRRL
jgi:hypothetical protein